MGEGRFIVCQEAWESGRSERLERALVELETRGGAAERDRKCGVCECGFLNLHIFPTTKKDST